MSRVVENDADASARDAVPGAAIPPSQAIEVCAFVIAGRDCRIRCVDGVLPSHRIGPRPGARARLAYVEGEVAHFELSGHQYALVCEDIAPPVSAPNPVTLPADIRQLLTNRELQIVQLICMGCLTKQVAHRLHISEFTVRSYLKTIYCKLGVRSRGAMVYRYAQAFSQCAQDE
jgi:DNA-binding CsgD family transcriptional regulator